VRCWCLEGLERAERNVLPGLEQSARLSGAAAARFAELLRSHSAAELAALGIRACHADVRSKLLRFSSTGVWFGGALVGSAVRAVAAAPRVARLWPRLAGALAPEFGKELEFGYRAVGVERTGASSVQIAFRSQRDRRSRVAVSARGGRDGHVSLAPAHGVVAVDELWRDTGACVRCWRATWSCWTALTDHRCSHEQGQRRVQCAPCRARRFAPTLSASPPALHWRAHRAERRR
jgi:hypothetical protein